MHRFATQEPMQSTLEPLALGIRLSFATGNAQFAMVNTIYYVARSFNSGKNIRVLSREVEALARQHGNHFELTCIDVSQTSSDKPAYSPLLQYYLTPLYNTLYDLEGGEDDDHKPPFFLDKIQFAKNEDILNATLKTEQLASMHGILSYEIMKAFMFRDMDNALRFTNIAYKYFLVSDLVHVLGQFWLSLLQPFAILSPLPHIMLSYTQTREKKGLHYTNIFLVFYEALITFHFARLRGK